MLKEIKQRKSEYNFSLKKIEESKIKELIEAARLAPSSFNNQPWNYVFVSKKDKNRKELENALNITNKWAKKAYYLIVVGSNVKKDTVYNDIEYYLYDCGLSVMSLVIQAENLGLKSHQMAGWNKEKVKKAVNFNNINPIVVIALGYSEKNSGFFKKLNIKLKEKILRQRKRKPVKKNFFYGYKK